VLVEDNPTDAELCLRSLKGHNLANNVVWLRDGARSAGLSILARRVFRAEVC
jgi:hypothetical protein